MKINKNFVGYESSLLNLSCFQKRSDENSSPLLTGGVIAGRGIKQLIAKKEIHFSNSMIEAVFRQFKQKFLKKRPKNFKSVYQQVYKFVTKYNQKIPHTSLEGITPAEKFRGHICTKKLKVIFKQKMKEFRTSRTEKFRDCNQCRVKYLTESRLRW